MNKEYTYIDGKVIISDENNYKTQDEYYDNLDEVLVKENLIETMEEKIQKLDEESQFYKQNNRKYYIPIIFPVIVSLSTIVTPTLIKLFMSDAIVISIPIAICFLPLGAGTEFYRYKCYKKSLKEEKGINSELNFLKKQIKKEKEKLESLKQERTRKKEKTDFRVVKVNDLQQLENLKNYLQLYYDLGYNYKKYYKYFKKDKLAKKLEKDYTSRGIQLAMKYMENKDKSLTLNKKIK